MLVLMLRTALIYFIIIFSMRLMGKKQLGELQPSELVSTILISNLASICIESPEIPIAGSVVPVLLIVCLEILLSAACARSRRLSAFLSGNACIVVRRGEIDQNMLRRLRFSVDDLLEALRAKDIFELEDVELAIVETNGSVSVCKRPGADTVKLDDLSLEKPADRLPRLPVLVQGLNDPAILSTLALEDSLPDRLLKKENCPRKEALLLFCNAAGEYRLIRKQPPTANDKNQTEGR